MQWYGNALCLVLALVLALALALALALEIRATWRNFRYIIFIFLTLATYVYKWDLSAWTHFSVENIILNNARFILGKFYLYFETQVMHLSLTSVINAFIYLVSIISSEFPLGLENLEK